MTSLYTHPRDIAMFCEGEAMTAICTPTGNVRISKKCADSEEGVAFTAALVGAAIEEARRALP